MPITFLKCSSRFLTVLCVCMLNFTSLNAQPQQVIEVLGGLGGVQTDEGESDDPEGKKPDNASLSQADYDRETLKEAGLADEGEALLDYFRQRLTSEDQEREILALIHKMGADSFDQRERATEEVIKYGLAAVGLLRQAQEGDDFEIALRAERCLNQIEKIPSPSLASCAARRLADHQPPGTAEVLLKYLPHADDEAVADDIRDTLATVAMKEEEVNETLVQALEDREPLIKGAAAEALIRGNARAMFPRIERMLEEESDVNQRARIAFALVTAAKKKDTVPTMIKLMGKAELDRAWQIEEVLWQLAGEKGPEVSLGADDRSREKASEAWLAWWNKHGGEIDLAKLDEGPRMLGYTIVLEMDNRNRQGSVVELDANKKERWRIDNLQFVIDAEVLPGKRVLIAEHNRHQVSERTFDGKVIWQKQVLMPVSVQRLPNGNTFVAARNQLYEWDAKRKQVWNFNRPQQDIVAAERLRNGEVVFVTNNGHCVRVNRDGKILKDFPVGRVQYYSGLDLLPNNRVLITQYNAVAEFDLRSGKPTGWSQNIRGPTAVQRLPNGNTLVNSMNSNKVVEMDRSGKTKWEYQPKNARPWKAFRR